MKRSVIVAALMALLAISASAQGSGNHSRSAGGHGNQPAHISSNNNHGGNTRSTMSAPSRQAPSRSMQPGGQRQGGQPQARPGGQQPRPSAQPSGGQRPGGQARPNGQMSQPGGQPARPNAQPQARPNGMMDRPGGQPARPNGMMDRPGGQPHASNRPAPAPQHHALGYRPGPAPAPHHGPGYRPTPPPPHHGPGYRPIPPRRHVGFRPPMPRRRIYSHVELSVRSNACRIIVQTPFWSRDEAMDYVLGLLDERCYDIENITSNTITTISAPVPTGFACEDVFSMKFLFSNSPEGIRVSITSRWWAYGLSGAFCNLIFQPDSRYASYYAWNVLEDIADDIPHSYIHYR